jgi:hypothetical protein
MILEYDPLKNQREDSTDSLLVRGWKCEHVCGDNISSHPVLTTSTIHCRLITLHRFRNKRKNLYSYVGLIILIFAER